MVSANHTLIFIIIFFLHGKLLVAGSVESTQGGMSGEDVSDEKGFMIVENLRLLLGLKSLRIRNTDRGFLSPAPAPVPVPTLKPMAETNFHSHRSSSPRWKFNRPILRHEARQKKDGDGRMVVLVSICSGVAFVIAVLGLILICFKFKRSRQRRWVKKISGSDDECGKSKYVNSSQSTTTSNVSFDLVPQQLYRKSLDPISETDASDHSKWEELESVEKASIGGNSIASSDDESFHSIRGSCSSNAHISDEDLSNAAQVCSPHRVLASMSSQTCSRHIPLSPKLSSNGTTSSSPQHKSQKISASRPQWIPPPPIQPPSFKEGGNSKQAPPPPPGQFITPVGKDGSPLPKLKPLHWDKVRAGLECSTIWDKMKSSSFEFDEQMIETLFGYNMQTKNEEAKSKTPSPAKHILEPKRLQNLTILLKALNATKDQVCDALMQGGDHLNLQQLEVLTKMVPTKEEATKLLNYQGDSNELDSVERLIQAMLSVPFAFTRIEAMLYRGTFEDEMIHLKKSFAMLEEACKELRSSRLFLKLLDAVLKTGNRMNVGTIRGGARAFKLDALLKLADVKGTDGKTTLLHFVVQEVIRSEEITESEIVTMKSNQKTKNMTPGEREEDYRRLGLDLVSSLCTELCNVKKTATIDLDVIASSVSTLSDGMVKLQRLVHDASSIEQDGHFVGSMQSFLNKAEKNIKELQKDEDQVLLHVKDITEYFHGHVGKDEVNPLRIFVIVRDFLGMLDQVCKELRSLKMTPATLSDS